MNKARKTLVRQAFGLLDRSGDGVATIEDLLMTYDPSAHPEVINGKLTPEVSGCHLHAALDAGAGPWTPAPRDANQAGSFWLPHLKLWPLRWHCVCLSWLRTQSRSC